MGEGNVDGLRVQFMDKYQVLRMSLTDKAVEQGLLPVQFFTSGSVSARCIRDFRNAPPIEPLGVKSPQQSRKNADARNMINRCSKMTLGKPNSRFALGWSTCN